MLAASSRKHIASAGRLGAARRSARSSRMSNRSGQARSGCQLTTPKPAKYLLNVPISIAKVPSTSFSAIGRHQLTSWA